MKKLIALFALLLLVGCGTRKAEMQRQIDIYKTELREHREKEKTTDATIEKIQSQFNKVVDQLVTSRELFQKQLAEMAESMEKSNAEIAEDISINNAAGTVKLTDSKGNRYEIPSGTGTTINKTSNEKLQKENTELKKAFHNEFKSNESLQRDLQQKETVNTNLRATVKEKNAEITKLNQKVSDLSKSKNKKTESKRSDFAWYVVAFILGMVALRLLQTQVSNFLNYLNNKR